MSSRLDGSTVFIVSLGPQLVSILETFLYPVGRHGLHYFPEMGSSTSRPNPIGAPICFSGAIGAAVEPCFVPLIASGPPPKAVQASKMGAATSKMDPKGWLKGAGMTGRSSILLQFWLRC